MVVHVLRKPCSEGTVASNVLRHGCGGLNIDATRIAYPSGKGPESGWSKSGSDGTKGYQGTDTFKTRVCSAEEITARVAGGRWPANLILEHQEGCQQDGVKRVKKTCGGNLSGDIPSVPGTNVYAGAWGRSLGFAIYADADGKETVAAWNCQPGCPVAGLDDQSGCLSKQGSRKKLDTGDKSFLGTGFGGATSTFYGDAGGASRFFKQVQSSGAEKP